MTKIYDRQQRARKDLDQIWEHTESVHVIHYSCESFYDRQEGNSPRITSIAVRNLGTAQTQSFSIHKYGEIKGYTHGELEQHYNELEKTMLAEFFVFVKMRSGHRWVHWNMRDINYGFHALEHRFRVLGGKPEVIVDDKKFDLSRIFIGRYGRNYIDHPRLENLIKLNKITDRNFKTGKEEASLFQSKDYVSLHQSTLAKTDVLANICQQAYEGGLKTTATFWQLNGSSLRTFISWLNENPVVIAIVLFSSLIGVINALDLVWSLWK